jgi:hypothetical protein
MGDEIAVMFLGNMLLQQLPIKQTTRKFLKALLSNAFKNFLGLGLSAKRCKFLT